MKLNYYYDLDYRAKGIYLGDFVAKLPTWGIQGPAELKAGAVFMVDESLFFADNIGEEGDEVPEAEQCEFEGAYYAFSKGERVIDVGPGYYVNHEGRLIYYTGELLCPALLNMENGQLMWSTEPLEIWTEDGLDIMTPVPKQDLFKIVFNELCN